MAVVHLIEERLFDRPRRVEIEHGGRWWPASQSAWRLCDDGCGWMADVAWTEQHEWGPGKYMTMVSPERIRVVEALLTSYVAFSIHLREWGKP